MASVGHTGYPGKRLPIGGLTQAQVQAEADTKIDEHVAESDPHTQYQRESEKAQPNGYADLDANGRIPNARLASSGTADATTYLRGDRTWGTPPGGGGGGGSLVGVKAVRITSTQALAAATATAVDLNSEEWDDAAFHDNATNPSRFTVPTGQAGRYRVSGQVRMPPGGGEKHVRLHKTSGGVTTRFAMTNQGPPPTGAVFCQVVGEVSLGVGDYVQLMAYSANATNIDVDDTWLAMEKIA